MTPKPNRGGRPPAPRNAAECRLRISCEIMQRGRERRLRQLFRLLRTFIAAEKDAREETRIAAQNEMNRLAQEKLELQRREYVRRFAAGPLGQRTLLEQNTRLKARVTELELALANRGSIPTLTGSAGACA